MSRSITSLCGSAVVQCAGFRTEAVLPANAKSVVGFTDVVDVVNGAVVVARRARGSVNSACHAWPRWIAAAGVL